MMTTMSLSFLISTLVNSDKGVINLCFIHVVESPNASELRILTRNPSKIRSIVTCEIIQEVKLSCRRLSLHIAYMHHFVVQTVWITRVVGFQVFKEGILDFISGS